MAKFKISDGSLFKRCKELALELRKSPTVPDLDNPFLNFGELTVTVKSDKIS